MNPPKICKHGSDPDTCAVCTSTISQAHRAKCARMAERLIDMLNTDGLGNRGSDVLAEMASAIETLDRIARGSHV